MEQFAWEVLTSHFNVKAYDELISSRRQFPHHVRADLQQTILDITGRLTSRAVGLNQVHPEIALKLSALFVKSPAISLAPIQSQEVDVGNEASISIFDNALWLVTSGDQLKAAVLFEQHREGRFFSAGVEVVFMPNADGMAFAKELFEELETSVRKSRLYRGQAVSLEEERGYSGRPNTIQIHRLPYVARNQVILPDPTMQLIDRSIFNFINSLNGLKKLHQSLQKGVLLYGPPGNGKTHVIRYLASNLPQHTTILINANQVADLARYMLLARLLQPSMVVIEDVDLVGRHRNEMRGATEESLLNRLLNEMDGLHPDAEILFVLTTNRLEAIEEALALRPGRIDQVIEVPRPEPKCRTRLLQLYGASLNIPEDVVKQAVVMTDGASASFIKEFVRRVALESIMRGTPGTVAMSDLDSALQDVR